jgi:hypothetical protein
VLPERQFRAHRGELGLSLRDILHPRPRRHELGGFPGARQLCFRGANPRLRLVDFHLADGAPTAALGHGADAGQPLPRQCGLGLRCLDGGPRLSHFLRTAAVAQAQQDLVLDFDLGTSLSHPQGQGAGVEHAQHLTGLDLIAFVHNQFRDPSVAVEGEGNFADVDMAVKDNVTGAASLAPHRPCAQAGQQSSPDEQRGDQFALHDSPGRLFTVPDHTQF